MSRFIRFCVMAFIAFVCLSVFVSQTEAIPLETTQDATGPSAITSSECSEGNPCGWAVYGTSKLKRTQYFIRNTCRCKKDSTCMLGNEDLNLTAYVYRCKSNSQPVSA